MYFLQLFTVFSLSIVPLHSYSKKPIVVAGATGYIGRQVVSELVQRGIPTISLVRSNVLPDITAGYLKGSDIIQCDIFDQLELNNLMKEIQPDAAICCLASRSGVAKDSWAVDYQASSNLLNAVANGASRSHFVLLSAFCCGKPLLQFQFAKLKLEEHIRDSVVTHSIVRPTAFFKSLDGQIESARKGNPIIFFGDGTCAANAICEKDLAKFLVDCALVPNDIGMLDVTRNIGGPDVPPVPKRQQAEYIYDALDVPEDKRVYLSVPLFVLDLIINSLSLLEGLFTNLRASELQQRFEDAAEIARIIKYYASEPMIAIGDQEVQGTTRLKDHFLRLAQRGGQLEEIDKMTTTAGIIEIFSKNDFDSKFNKKNLTESVSSAAN